MGSKELLQKFHKRALFEGRENLIFPAQAFDWTSRNGANSTLAIRNMLAEREGFEPPVRFPVHLISSLTLHSRYGPTQSKIEPIVRPFYSASVSRLPSPAPQFSPTFLYSERMGLTCEEVTFGAFAQLAA